MTRMSNTAWLGLFGLVLLLPCAGCGDAVAETHVDPSQIVPVGRSTLRVVVREAGEVDAFQMTNIRNEVEGRRNTLIYLAPQGIVVEKGDKLAEIDAGELVDKRADQEIKLERARAVLVEAEKKLEIQLKEIAASEEKARSDLKVAQLAWDKFMGTPPEPGTRETDSIKGTNAEMVAVLSTLVRGTAKADLVDEVMTGLIVDKKALDNEMGEMAQRVLAQIDACRLSDSDLKVKETNLHYSRQLFEKNYITRTELKSDELETESTESKSGIALNKLDLMVSYELRKERIRLRQDVRNAELALEKVEASNTGMRAREEADYKSKQAEFNLAKERFDHLVKQIDKAVIRAPTPGLVIHAREGMRSRDAIEEGMDVREYQTLIRLPDFSKMIVSVKIQEADINKVAVGQTAKIQVDAFPDQTYTGKISRVAVLPDSGSRYFSQELRVYKTRVVLEGTHKELRPGMSASVEILVGDVENALCVPIETVQMQGTVPYVWKQVGDGFEATRIEVGAGTVEAVQVLSGLAEGDRVVIGTPPGCEPPVFEQPDRVKPAPPSEVGQHVQVTNGEAGPALSREERTQLMAQIKAFVIKKFPDRAGDLEGRMWMRVLREDEVRQALEADAELGPRYQKWRSSMRNRMNRRDRGNRGNRGGRNPGGRNPGGRQGGFGGGRGGRPGERGRGGGGR